MIEYCDECAALAPVSFGTDGNAYCSSCWDWDALRHTRCFTVAAIYDARGALLTTGASDVGVGCAERVAMWNLSLDAVGTPKTIVVARIRRNRNNKMNFGNSKPCTQCIQAMQLYGVDRVGYSTKEGFVWEDAEGMKNTYSAYSPILVTI